ncbi:MAG: ribosome maturation factor RimP [Ferrimicrobium sp.]|uniref:ribosome maturation factor RimP n=3 Tax=Ferrimicrobium sp. TaxID=2926050 RepID=UPI0026132198|nr:hypothetical protein [Ferrimicrobium sp.]
MLSSQTLIDLLDPVIAPLDLRVLSATWHGRVLDLRLEHYDASAPSLDEIAQASKTVSAVLDDAGGQGDGTYTLEVSSPGLERPLLRLTHFQWATGRDIQFTSTDGVVAGVLARVFDESEPRIEVIVEGESRLYALREIDQAMTVFQWGTKNKNNDGRRQVDGA